LEAADAMFTGLAGKNAGSPLGRNFLHKRLVSGSGLEAALSRKHEFNAEKVF
jgi:hypothetical protein